MKGRRTSGQRASQSHEVLSATHPGSVIISQDSQAIHVHFTDEETDAWKGKVDSRVIHLVRVRRG